MNFRSLFPLFEIHHRFGRGNPGFGNDVVNRSLNSLRIALGEQTQVFVPHFDFGPYTFIQHGTPSFLRFSLPSALPGLNPAPDPSACSVKAPRYAPMNAYPRSSRRGRIATFPRLQEHSLFCAPLRISRKTKLKPLRRKSQVHNDSNEREDSNIPIRCDA